MFQFSHRRNHHLFLDPATGQPVQPAGNDDDDREEK